MYFVKKIKLILRFCFSYCIGLIKYDFEKNKLLIFNYHNFNHSINIDDEMYVSYENFKKQLTFFKNSNLLISYNDFLKLKNKKYQSKKILITIDDADFSVKKTLSIVDKLKVPIILFLPIGLILDKKDVNYYKSVCLHNYFFSKNKIQSMQKKEEFFNKIVNSNLENLKKTNKILSAKNQNTDYVIKRKKIEYNFFKKINNSPYITIGSHSMSHVKLSELPYNWLEWEVKKSLKYIKKLKGNYQIFSLPYGNYDSFNPSIINFLTANKIKHIFSTTGVVNNYDNLLLGRSFVLNSNKNLYINGLINGSMNLFEKLLFRVHTKKKFIYNKNNADDIYPLW